MDNERILDEIKESLNGDKEHDVNILVSKLFEYREDKQLVAEIAVIAAGYLTEEGLENLDASLQKNMEEIHEAYEKAFSLAEIGLYSEALDHIDYIVQDMMPLEFYVHGNQSEFRSFSQLFERDMYIEFEKPGVPVEDSPLPCTEIFVLHGSILMALGRVQEAITSLSLALLWNPASHDAVIMLSEAYKLEGNVEMLHFLTMNSFKYAFRKVYLAELYYNLGYYYATQERWEDSMACLTLSAQYGGKEFTKTAVYQIERRLGRKMPEPDMEEIRKHAEACGYQIGPDRRILVLARELGQEAYADGYFEDAEYYYQIAYDLFDDEEDKNMLDSLRNQTILM